MSHVTEKMACVLSITLQHTTTKHAQTVGMLEQSQPSIKQVLKIETGERRSLCHKYVSIALFNYKTSYYTSNGCEPSRGFHGHIPFNVLDL